MDDLDQKILAALAADSSTSTARLARRFKVARSTVQTRIERMEANGTIAGYTVKLGKIGLARRIKATVLLEIDARESAALVQKLKALPEVEVVHTTTGRWSMILQIAADTTMALDEVIDRIGLFQGVKASESLIHMTTKFDRAV